MMSSTSKPKISKEQLDKIRPKAAMVAQRLQEKFPSSIKVDDLINYVFQAAEREDEGLMKAFRTLLGLNKDIVSLRNGEAFRYKPPYDIQSPDALIAYFQSSQDTRSIEVAKLKKGWPDCEQAIDKLEDEHKLIVMRNKKDSTPRHIWVDDAALCVPFEKEFVEEWNKQQLPSVDDAIRFIRSSGRTPAGQVADIKVAAKPTKKIRKARASVKQTNKHMAGLLRDYSDKRQKGK